MKRLFNPYTRIQGYHCFGCSPENQEGLKMEFFEDGDAVVSRWEPEERFQGFTDVLHGGIQSTLMDEIASWVVFTRLNTAGMTYRLQVKFKAPVRISLGTLSLRAGIGEVKRNIATILVSLFDGHGTLCSEGTVDYYLLAPEKAAKELHYPGREAFYEK